MGFLSAGAIAFGCGRERFGLTPLFGETVEHDSTVVIGQARDQVGAADALVALPDGVEQLVLVGQ